MTAQPSRPWTLESAADTYGVHNWGAGYYDISEFGDVLVHPHGLDSAESVNLREIVAGLKERGTGMPVLMRFSDILASRIAILHDSFREAMQGLGYRGAYQGVYPIKVNQQQHVVEEIVAAGQAYHHGLEVGSKAELIAALAYVQHSEALIVCNGYKDEEYIDLSLYARKMDLQVVLVVETPSELPRILERSNAMGVKPRLGIRAELATRSESRWTASSGDNSMFGLNATQLIASLDYLKKQGMLDCLTMLHFHQGSQISNIRSIRAAVAEATRIYVDLVKEGAPMGWLDVGGGLAVDYDGSNSNSASSSNYSISEYAADIVEVVMDQADRAGVRHPVIVSESGRALVAHHSVLLFDVFNVSHYHTDTSPPSVPDDVHELVRNLVEVGVVLAPENLQECYNDAIYYREEIRSQFEHGSVSLRERALGEQVSRNILTRIALAMKDLERVPDEMEGLPADLADVYHCNFSVFQSLPDSWAINQLFPVMPIHRLAEEPTEQATLADITCDCDGRIDTFIDRYEVKRTLPVHALNGKDYFMGVFLVGAYQETLGDLHNLLGDPNVVSVKIRKDGALEYDQEIAGDTVADVLSYVEYNPSDMINRVRRMAESTVRSSLITPGERREIMAAYEGGLRGYTYFES